MHIMHIISDTGILSIIAAAVVLLILIVINFIIVARHIHALEDETDRLESHIRVLGNSVDELTTHVQTLTRRTAAHDKSIKFLTDNTEELVDQQQEFSSQMDEMNVRQDQFKNILDQNIPENQSTLDATRLLRQGMSVDEVAEKTKLPKYEVEMLNAVHGQHDQQPIKSTRAAPASKAENVETEMQKSGHVASLRARNAYGIGNTLKKR